MCFTKPSGLFPFCLGLELLDDISAARDGKREGQGFCGLCSGQRLCPGAWKPRLL